MPLQTRATGRGLLFPNVVGVDPVVVTQIEAAPEFINDVARPQLLAGLGVDTGNIAAPAQMVEPAVVVGRDHPNLL